MRTGWWWWHLVWQSSGRYRGHRAHALHGSPIDTWPRVVCPSQCTCNSKSTTSCASTCSSCTCTSHFAWRLVPTSASCRLCRTKTNLLSPLSPPALLCSSPSLSFSKNDHVDNNRLPKKIKPLPLHSRVVYLEKISHFTQVLSDSLVGCPTLGANKYQLTRN